MKKLALLVALGLFVSLGSAAFYTVEQSNSKKANASKMNGFNAQENVSDTDKTGNDTGENSSLRKSSKSNSGFLPLTGGELLGALNLGGNEIQNVGTPDDPQDAATKRYVDTNVGSGNGTAVSNDTGTPGLPSVLLENNVATTPIRFLEGVMLGENAEADDGSIAIGDNTSASNSSVAIGTDSRATNGTAKIGSAQQPMDLEVTGDLEVSGDAPNDDVVLESGTVNATEEGIFVLIGSDSYTVSLTSVNSFGDVAVFNKTDEGFEIRSENGTVTTDFLVMENN